MTPSRPRSQFAKAKPSGTDRESGSAGGSAQKEYERRRANDRSAIKRNLWWTIPFVLIASFAGGILADSYIGGLGVLPSLVIAGFLRLTFWGPKQTTVAHRTGAEGERRTASVFDKLPGYVVLHDRKIPGKRANIDHIAIGPGGVFVIETKNYKDEAKVRRGELFVGGRRKPEFITQVWEEAGVVQAVLAEHVARLAFDVKPVLCFSRSDTEWTKLEGVETVGPTEAEEVDL
jgi:hypothetical protein